MKARQVYKKVKWLFRKEVEIPEEWEVRKIDSVIKSIQSGVSRLLTVTDIGYVVATSGNIQNGQFDVTDLKYWYKIDTKGVDLRNYILNNDDILLNFINSLAQIGKSCMFKQQDRDWIFTTNIFRIKSKSDTSQKFLFNLLNTSFTMNQIHAITQPAVNQASFSQGSFKKIKILLPPLPEQQKITSILSNVDAQIQQTQKLIDLTQRLKKGLIQNLLTGRIGHTDFESVNYGLRWMKANFPKKWEPTPISKLCKLRKTNQISSELYVGLEHIGQGNNQLIEKGNVSSFESNKNIFEKGDILYGKLRPYLNKVWLATEPGYCSTDVLALQVNDKILNEFLLYVLLSKIFVDFAIATSSGTKMPRTNWDDMKKFHVVLPSLPEQEQILSILSNVDEQIQQHKNEKALLGRIKKGLMQQLLTGQRRVKVGV